MQRVSHGRKHANLRAAHERCSRTPTCQVRLELLTGGQLLRRQL